MKQADLPAIGQPLSGGFYAGLILVGTDTHAIIVSPKEHGTGKFTWGEYGQEIEALHYSDGKANTIALAESDSELGKWAIGLFRQATHNHAARKKLAKIILLRGKAVNQSLTKTYKSGGAKAQ